MARVSASTWKRLERLEQTQNTARPLGEWPKLLSVDKWEALAMPMQEKLLRGEPAPRKPETLV